MAAQPEVIVALALSAVLILPAAPAVQTLLTGQVNFLVLLPLALVPELSRRGHERTAGAMIALAAMLKLTPVLLLGYLALRRRWAALVAAAVSLATLSLVCAIALGPAALPASLVAALQTGSADSALGHNEALLASLLPAGARWAAVLSTLVRVALAVLIAGMLWQRTDKQATSVGARRASE